ncbi:hypothetical protein [Burkholderia multivorans]|uniref:hypothetical protein n=1 Tax=Burkholderia multivorans TaxID=87883 RepID=UPI0012DE712A|nr:hypothetical protein [Burkholderia multivorans]
MLAAKAPHPFTNGARRFTFSSSHFFLAPISRLTPRFVYESRFCFRPNTERRSAIAAAAPICTGAKSERAAAVRPRRRSGAHQLVITDRRGVSALCRGLRSW